MRNRYYVSNDALPGPTYVGGAYLITPLQIGTAVLTPDQAKALKDQGYTIHLKDLDIEYGTGPEGEEQGGGGSDNLGTFYDFNSRTSYNITSEEDKIITYDDRKANYTYIVNSPGDGELHSVGIEPGLPGERMRLEINVNDGDSGQDNVNIFLAAENAFYDATGTWQISNFFFEDSGWIELETDPFKGSWRVTNTQGARGYEQAIITPGMPNIYCYVTSDFGYSTGAYGDTWYPYNHINLRMIVPEENQPAVAQCNVPAGKFQDQRVRIYLDEISATCTVQITGSWNCYLEDAQIQQPVMNSGGSWCILRWQMNSDGSEWYVLESFSPDISHDPI